MRTALICVDIQNDFCPGGALAVLGGDEVVEPVNRLVALFRELGLPVILTRDWHPAEHISFHARGGPWPPHCVQHTPGAAFHADLDAEGGLVVSKAEADDDAYSGFEGTDLDALLRAEGVERVVVAGLATDYCVKNTVFDALLHGFEVWVVPEAIRAVNVEPGDGEAAEAAMELAGAEFCPEEEVALRLRAEQGA